MGRRRKPLVEARWDVLGDEMKNLGPPSEPPPGPASAADEASEAPINREAPPASDHPAPRVSVHPAARVSEHPAAARVSEHPAARVSEHPAPRISEHPAPAVPVLPELDSKTIYSGPLLKQIREARGKTLREISDKTRVGAPSLTAMEAERFEELPDARIYIRGFVRCMAVELGLDPEAVAATYLKRWDAWSEERKDKKKPVLRSGR